jgi:L-fucose isomerase-like protein
VRIANTPPPGDLACRPDKLSVLPVEETIRRMKASRIVAIKGPEKAPDTTTMGIPVVYVPFSELNDAWAAADKDEARAVADRWIKTASRIEGVSREELLNSAAMYLGEKAVLEKHKAMGITINCLGGFYGGHIHAYPCLGFHELNNQGLVGGCECDVPSAAAMVAGTIMTEGRPGYISDPVIDTAKRQIIYAHCVASNRAFGPQGEVNPFEILTHSEDRQGAAVRSVLPVGYMTTTIEISDPRKEIILHQAKAVANDPDDRACRTKLAAEPLGDVEKLFTMWDKWGWHRVTFYGDLKKPVRELAAALGWKIVEET